MSSLFQHSLTADTLSWWVAHLFPRYKPVVQAELSSRIQEARKKIPNIKLDWQPPNTPLAHYNASKVALLIEPRPISHLVPQILHMIAVVPPDWRFLFIGSPQSVFAVGQTVATKHHQAIGKLNLMVLPDLWAGNGMEDVSRMLTDVRFYDEFLPGVEWLLKYEQDSILCANSETSLNEWLDWSWAGSTRYASQPLSRPELRPSRRTKDQFAGDGGLSMRRVSAVKRIISFQTRYNDTEPEDEWFGRRLAALPGERVASRFGGDFAVENALMDKPMGYHVRSVGSDESDIWKTPESRRKILEYCPELTMVMDMELERQRCARDNKHNDPPIDAQLAAAKIMEENRKLREAQAKAKALAQKNAQAQAQAMIHAQVIDEANMVARARQLALERAKETESARAKVTAQANFAVDKVHRILASPPPPLPPMDMMS